MALLVSRWVERLLAGHEPPLTVAQFLALRAIAREEITGAELARRAAVSGAAVSQLVGALEQAGYLVRQPESGDRRRYALVVSAEGERVLRSATALLSEGLGQLLAELPRPEADALEQLLPRLEAALGGTPPPRRPPPPGPPRTHRPPR